MNHASYDATIAALQLLRWGHWGAVFQEIKD